MVTDDPVMYDGEERDHFRKNNVSEEKIEINPAARERRVRKSQADIEIKTRKSRRVREKEGFREEQAGSITKLPELKRNNLPSISSQQSKIDFSMN